MPELELINEIKESIIDIHGFVEGDIAPETNLIDDLGLDDIDIITVIMDLEENHNVDLDIEFEDVTTVKDLLDALAKAGVL